MTRTEDTLLNQEIRDLLGGPPPASPMTPVRALARGRHLESEVGRQAPVRRGRRVAVAGAAFGVAVLLAAASTAAYRAWAPATDTSFAQCFSAASLDSLGTTVTTASTSADPGPQAVDALEGCSTVWRAGLMTLGQPGLVDRATLATDAPVPDLVACRLDSGAAGVFPGDDRTCFELGLPRLATG